jgi:IS5 family transposase
MAIRKIESMGFVDAALDGLGDTRAATLPGRLDAATPWETLAAPIRQLPEYNAPAPRAGHPAWRPVLIIKCLMLAKWFNLSDPGLEDTLKDRISFRRFVGLSFTDETPDKTPT